MHPANETARGAVNAQGQESANAASLAHSKPASILDTMHTAAGQRDAGMARVMRATIVADRAAISSALCAGWRKISSGTAEQAWDAAGVPWPLTAPPRALGPIVRHLAAAGLIVAERWELGRSPRSHRGKVTRWRWIGGAA